MLLSLPLFTLAIGAGTLFGFVVALFRLMLYLIFDYLGMAQAVLFDGLALLFLSTNRGTRTARSPTASCRCSYSPRSAALR